MTHDNPRYVKLYDVEERVKQLREYREKYPVRDGTLSYDDGWDEALMDLLDTLRGWCHEDVKVQHWVESP